MIEDIPVNAKFSIFEHTDSLSDLNSYRVCSTQSNAEVLLYLRTAAGAKTIVRQFARLLAQFQIEPHQVIDPQGVVPAYFDYFPERSEDYRISAVRACFGLKAYCQKLGLPGQWLPMDNYFAAIAYALTTDNVNHLIQKPTIQQHLIKALNDDTMSPFVQYSLRTSLYVLTTAAGMHLKLSEDGVVRTVIDVNTLFSQWQQLGSPELLTLIDDFKMKKPGLKPLIPAANQLIGTLHPCVWVNLEGADLGESALHYLRLAYADLRDSRWQSVRAQRLQLKLCTANRAIFSNAKLGKTLIIGCDLTRSNWKMEQDESPDEAKTALHLVTVRNSDFSDAQFSGVHATELKFQKSLLLRANMRDMNAVGLELDGVNADLSDWSEATIKQFRCYKSLLGEQYGQQPITSLRAANFYNASISSATLNSSRCDFSNFSLANLEKGSLTEASIVGANMTHANVKRLCVDGTDCKDVDWQSTQGKAENIREAINLNLTWIKQEAAYSKEPSGMRRLMHVFARISILMMGYCVSGWAPIKNMPDPALFVLSMITAYVFFKVDKTYLPMFAQGRLAQATQSIEPAEGVAPEAQKAIQKDLDKQAERRSGVFADIPQLGAIDVEAMPELVVAASEPEACLQVDASAQAAEPAQGLKQPKLK